MQKALKRFVNFYNKAEEYILVYSLAFTVILVFIQVVMRYVFNESISWSEELARYIFIWQVWLGASLAFRNSQHISVDIILDKLVGRARILFILFRDIITFAFNIFLVSSGFELVIKMMERGVVSSGIKLPLYIVYISVPFTAFIILFRVAGNIFSGVKSFIKHERSGI